MVGSPARGEAQAFIDRAALGKPPSQSPCIEQGHVGTLAQLGAGAMPSVADANEAMAVRTGRRAVRIAGEGQVLFAVDPIEQAGRLGPHATHLVLPRLQSGGAPRFVVDAPQ